MDMFEILFIKERNFVFDMSFDPASTEVIKICDDLSLKKV